MKGKSEAVRLYLLGVPADLAAFKAQVPARALHGCSGGQVEVRRFVAAVRMGKGVFEAYRLHIAEATPASIMDAVNTIVDICAREGSPFFGTLTPDALRRQVTAVLFPTSASVVPVHMTPYLEEGLLERWASGEPIEKLAIEVCMPPETLRARLQSIDLVFDDDPN